MPLAYVGGLQSLFKKHQPLIYVGTISVTLYP